MNCRIKSKEIKENHPRQMLRTWRRQRQQLSSPAPDGHNNEQSVHSENAWHEKAHIKVHKHTSSTSVIEQEPNNTHSTARRLTSKSSITDTTTIMKNKHRGRLVKELKIKTTSNNHNSVTVTTARPGMDWIWTMADSKAYKQLLRLLPNLHPLAEPRAVSDTELMRTVWPVGCLECVKTSAMANMNSTPRQWLDKTKCIYTSQPPNADVQKIF